MKKYFAYTLAGAFVLALAAGSYAQSSSSSSGSSNPGTSGSYGSSSGSGSGSSGTSGMSSSSGSDQQSGSGSMSSGSGSSGSGMSSSTGSGDTSSQASSSGGSQSVRQAQQNLQAAGFDPGPIDGKMGPKTSQALKDFQQSKGIQASGKLDSQTQQALASGGSSGSGSAGTKSGS